MLSCGKKLWHASHKCDIRMNLTLSHNYDVIGYYGIVAISLSAHTVHSVIDSVDCLGAPHLVSNRCNNELISDRGLTWNKVIAWTARYPHSTAFACSCRWVRDIICIFDVIIKMVGSVRLSPKNISFDSFVIFLWSNFI